jgi:LysM repeat protein
MPEKTPRPKSVITQWKRAYTVKSGDSLWKIGRMFNIDIDELKRRNNITTDSLAPGTMLIVP